MANYYLDTEFFEGFHKPMFGKRRHYIDLISVGLICDDGREYYAISNEFDLRAIWNNKDTWVKDNVLKKIHDELFAKQTVFAKTYFFSLFAPFTLKSMKNLIKWYGSSNAEIAQEIKDFVYKPFLDNNPVIFSDNWHPKDVNFYAYYADYDWVLFCSLFGRMLDLPAGFPMYCHDLKQSLDEYAKSVISLGYGLWYDYKKGAGTKTLTDHSFEESLARIKKSQNFPRQENEHSALDDARWNKKLHEFLLELK